MLVYDIIPPNNLNIQNAAPPVIFEWSRTWRENQKTYGNSIAVDNNNSIYLAGYTTNTTFGASDAFLIKYNAGKLEFARVGIIF